MRPNHWKQLTPVDQLTVTRSALEGFALNYEDGLYSKAEFLSKFYNLTDEIKMLEPYLSGELDWSSEEQAVPQQKLQWTRWYYGITHLEIGRGAGNGKDMATINRFPDGSCTLGIYNFRQPNIWTGNDSVYYKTVAEAMRIAEKRYDVKGEIPTAALPTGHPNNPAEFTAKALWQGPK
jgi:hypothetical protein